ncbi:MAG: hypothetical protein ABWX70_00065, partial [Hyphomicrobium sp.]
MTKWIITLTSLSVLTCNEPAETFSAHPAGIVGRMCSGDPATRGLNQLPNCDIVATGVAQFKRQIAKRRRLWIIRLVAAGVLTLDRAEYADVE